MLVFATPPPHTGVHTLPTDLLYVVLSWHLLIASHVERECRVFVCFFIFERVAVGVLSRSACCRHIFAENLGRAQQMASSQQFTAGASRAKKSGSALAVYLQVLVLLVILSFPLRLVCCIAFEHVSNTDGRWTRRRM